MKKFAEDEDVTKKFIDAAFSLSELIEELMSTIAIVINQIVKFQQHFNGDDYNAYRQFLP